MRTPLTNAEADFLKDLCFMFVKENYQDSSVEEVFNSLTAEHKKILTDKHIGIMKEVMCND